MSDFKPDKMMIKNVRALLANRTPGLWEYDEYRGVLQKGTGTVICGMCYNVGDDGSHDDGNTENNYCLIAAAPTYLELMANDLETAALRIAELEAALKTATDMVEMTFAAVMHTKDKANE